mgnify:CR=1 FL=1
MMEEKMLPVPNEGHRRRQKQRRRRFPWGSIATVILVVAVCAAVHRNRSRCHHEADTRQGTCPMRMVRCHIVGAVRDASK